MVEIWYRHVGRHGMDVAYPSGQSRKIAELIRGKRNRFGRMGEEERWRPWGEVAKGAA